MPRLFRSLCFVPGNNQRFIEKARQLRADIVCLDLEDSVPDDQKDAARQMVRQALGLRKRYVTEALYVRTNFPHSDHIQRDLEAVVCEGIDGIVVPKVGGAAELQGIEEALAGLERQQDMGPIGIMPSIESAQGVVRTYEIASFATTRTASRIDCVVFGVFDLLADLGVEYAKDSGAARYARARVALDARAAGVPAIDGVWQDLKDLQGLEADCALGRSLGYSGKSVIHPGQIEAVHRAFHPSESEVSWAKKVVAAYQRSARDGIGATTVEHRMIDEVHYRQARAVLELAGRH